MRSEWRSQPLAVQQSTAPSPSTLLRYSSDDLKADLERAHRAWKKYRKSRRRNAIYKFLQVIYEIVAVWHKIHDAKRCARRVLYLRINAIPKISDPYSGLLIAASFPQTIDRRTLAKLSRILKYSNEYKAPGVSLTKFVRGRGGLNEVAKLYSPRLGRKSKLARKS